MFDDYLNGAPGGAPTIHSPITMGVSPMTAAGAGLQSNGATLQGTAGRVYASSSSAIVLVWVILLVLLILSHTFTFELQR